MEERRGSGGDLDRVGLGTSENQKLEARIVVSSEESVGVAGESVDSRLRNNDSGLVQANCESGSSGSLNQVEREAIGDSGDLIRGNVVENVVVIDSENSSPLSKENEAIVEAKEGAIIRETPDDGGEVDKGNHVSLNNSLNGSTAETVIVINPQEAVCESGGNGEGKYNVLGSSKAMVEKEKPKAKVAEADKSCVIDMKGGASGGRGFKENCDGERVCRICHLSSEQSLECAGSTSTTDATATELIQLGCVCKDELGIAHSYCAEAWFKLKGNRLCEICGETAKNVTGVGDNRFMEEWNDHGFTIGATSSSEQNGGCWRGQPFCNFLMACLVIAFVLPWFFRVNMF